MLFVGVSARPASTPSERVYPRHTREHFRHNMAASVRADHPAIVPVANAIREVTKDPVEQIVRVDRASFQQAGKASMIIVAETREVIVAELINHHR